MKERVFHHNGVTARLICGDSAECLQGLAGIHCFVTSPPYDNLRTYGGHSWDFEATAQAMHGALAGGGLVAWNVGDACVDGSETLTSFRQAIYFKDVCAFRVHDTMIYEKTNFGHPEKARYHQLFEYVFILSKGPPRCFNPLRDKPNAWAGTGPFGVSTMRGVDGSQKQKKRNIIAEFGMRGNVWRCKTAGQERVCEANDHPAVMPFGLARDLVLSWSNAGDTVCDPFMGSATTASACMKHGRNFVGIEINPEYFEQSCDRIARECQQPMLL